MSAELAIVIKASAVVGAAQSALAALGGSTRALTQSIRQAETATAQLKRRLENPAAGAQVDRLKRSYDGLNRTLNSLKGTQSRLEKLTAKQQGLKETRANILSGWHSAVGAASAMIMPVKLAIDFESAMADVKKVVNFDTPQQFQEMERDILKLTRSIPMTGEELAAIVAAGGQSGVARENLIGFASDAAKMGVAFDMAAGQAGEAMATLSNVLQIPIPKIGVLGDAINHLSDNANSNAADIVNVLTRVGSDIKQLGLTENQGAALGSTFLSMGKAPELAAQAIKGMVTSLSILKAGGGKKELAELGLTTESFAKAMNEDAQGAIQDLMRRLKQLPKDAQYPLLLKMFGKNYADDVLLLANNTEEYNRQLDLLTEKDADGNLKYIGSMGREFDNRSATTANQLQLLKSSVAELGIDIGKVLLPPLNELVQSVRPLITGLTDWLRANPQVAKGLIKVALAVASFVAGSFFARLALNLFQSNLIVFSLRALKLRSALFQGKAAFQVFRAGALLGNGALLRQRNLAGTTYRAFARLARGYRNTNNALKAYLANTAKRGAQAVMGFRFAKIRLPKFRLPKLSFASALSGGAGVLKNLSSLILRGLLSPLKLLAGAFRAVAVAMRLLAFNPFGLLIAALMLAAVAVYTYWEPIKAFFAGFWQGLKQGLAPLMPLFEGFMRLMAQVGSAVMDGLGGVWAFIQPLVQPIIDWFSDFFAVSSEAETKAASFGEALGLWVGGAISGLVGLVSTAWNNITGFFSSGIANISA
ncbi:phage tail tape measure protein, partial [Bergeriella denitrificans]